jgi:hypothetical protein
MPDSCGEKKDATAIVDNQARSDFALPVDVNASEHQANCVNDQVNENQQLTEDGNFDAVNPAPETIHNHCHCSEFKEGRNAFTKKGLILRPHTVSANFAAYILTNVFEHGE